MYPFQIVYAQFTPATATDQSFSVGTVYGRNTGCDILEYAGDVYRVSVWEPTGTTQSFGWVVDISGTPYTGTLPFTATGTIGDPDVCLLIKPESNEIFAAVVYYDVTNSEWDLEFYQWDTFTLQFVSASIFIPLATGFFGTSINIDGNDHPSSEFAIVWDDVDDVIHTTVGDMGSLVLYNDLTLTSGTHPDVSMFYDGTNDVVHLTYIEGGGDLNVVDYDFADLVVGNATSPTIILSYTPTNGVYTYPRIACPTGASGIVADWTVVVEEMDLGLSKYYIVGFCNSTGATPMIYNDGLTFSPADLTLVPNYYVSVCYDSNFPINGGIWVGWQFDDSSFPYQYNSTTYTNYIEEAGYSIILKCDQDAVPILPDYLQVPSAITANNGDFSGFLSLAGRYGADELFLTFQNIIINGSNVDEINYKAVSNANTTSNFREGTTYNYEFPSLNQLKDDALIEMSILNIEGKLLFKESITKQDIQFKLNHYSKDLSSSIYLVSLKSKETGIVYRYKSVIGH